MDSHSTQNWHQQLVAHRDWLRSVVFSRLGEPACVDDVVSDVLADAMSRSPQADPVIQVGPWLYRLAIHKVLQFRRAQGRYRNFRNRLSDQPDAHVGRMATVNPLEVVLGNERVERTRIALQKLPGRDAEMLMLKYVHGWSYQQISENLGVAINKVAHRMRKARKRFRQELMIHDISYGDI